ncbi:MAG: hypothetical protein A3K54_04505 [Omnitrophica WOR_2 bacterium RBG_13_44_8]|nr:MAG: hypothetical protein A3K54_04505 [Omnitrophica WOR_2 bacterium RBG_13_44_8]
MILNVLRWIYLLPLIFLTFPLSSFAQEKYLPYPGIIHIHSSVSEEGIYPPARLVSLARDKGIKILIFSDYFLRRWEYGLPPFSNILKIRREEKSVVTYGVRRYWEDFKKIKEEFPDMLILEGVELSPFYWWSGNPFKKNFSLRDWNINLLVVGLKKYQDYARLPVIGNRYILPRLKDIPHLSVCLLLVILGISLLKKQRKIPGYIFTVAGILFFLHLFPFSSSRYNLYYGNKKYRPYQDLIDYVREKGGLVFWSYPEITGQALGRRLAAINFYTLTYPESLVLTSGYTGFGVNMLPGTPHNLILAEGQWDKVLTGYCAGKRSQPVWVIGEAECRDERQVGPIQNIFFLPKFSEEYAYEALRKGRLYVRYYSGNQINVSLEDFRIQDSENITRSAFMGDEIAIRGKPQLRIKGNYTVKPLEDLRLEVIRNGKIIKSFVFKDEGVFDLEFQDDSPDVSSKKSYYRLNFFAGEKIILVTNPIFIEI